MIYFTLQGDAYVPFGEYRIQNRKFIKGAHHVQGLGQAVGVDSNGDIPAALLKDYPDIFNLESFQFAEMYKQDAFDIGANQIGVSPYQQEIVIPKFRLVTLLHRIDTDVSNSVETVEFDASLFATPTAATTQLDLIIAGRWTVSEYVEAFVSRGLNRNGGAYSSLYPRGVSQSIVDSLSHAGSTEFTQVNGSAIPAGVRVCLSRQGVRNSLPLFDFVYLQGYGILNDKATTTQSMISGTLLRWRGGQVSESRQLPNVGTAIPQGSDISGANLPLLDQNLVVDGVTYTGANDINVTKTFR